MRLREKLRICEVDAGTARSVEPFRNGPRAEIALLLDASVQAAETYKLNCEPAPAWDPF